MENITLKQAEQYGFVFPGARQWMNKANMAGMAHDAALITTPNTTVPAELLAFIDPMVIEILTAPRNAREIFPEMKKGDWMTPYAKWRMDEFTGTTQPYSDYANGTTSGVNSEWAVRQQYVFQTSVTYGDLEVAMSSVAKINLASAKQRAAATQLDIDSNKFALLGVAGREVYGILNDPNLPEAVTAAPVGTGSSTYWADKTTQQIFNDIRALYAELANNSKGLISPTSPMKLCLSPAMSVYLGNATDFNVTVQDMVSKFMPNCKIVIVPELSSVTAGETALLVADEVNGQPVGYIGYGEKMRAGRIIPDMSSFRQKFVASTYGGVVLQPFAIASMVGLAA